MTILEKRFGRSILCLLLLRRLTAAREWRWRGRSGGRTAAYAHAIRARLSKQGARHELSNTDFFRFLSLVDVEATLRRRMTIRTEGRKEGRASERA